MGRSYLSIKLALAFGLCVALLVAVVERTRDVADMAGGPAGETSASLVYQTLDAPAAPLAPSAPGLPQPPSEAPPAPEVICLWRACPGEIAPIRPSEAAPRPPVAHRRRVAVGT